MNELCCSASLLSCHPPRVCQVRRTADPAKEQVREFVGKWRDDPAVRGDVSHSEIIGVSSEV